MPQPISPKPKTRFKYYREVRNTWLGVCLVGLTFSLAYPRVIEPRLNSGDTDTPITSPAGSQDYNRAPNTPAREGDQKLPRDVTGSSGSTGGGVQHNRTYGSERENNNPFSGGNNTHPDTGSGSQRDFGVFGGGEDSRSRTGSESGAGGVFGGSGSGGTGSGSRDTRGESAGGGRTGQRQGTGGVFGSEGFNGKTY